MITWPKSKNGGEKSNSHRKILLLKEEPDLH